MRKAVIIILGCLFALSACTAGCVAVIANLDDTKSITTVPDRQTENQPQYQDEPEPKSSDFGSVAEFKDGSTLTCKRPVRFTRSKYAMGGKSKPLSLKVQCTFTNRSGKTFDPALTDGSMTAGGAEGESIYQDGLDAPDNPILNGKSITWWMGYGVDADSDVQLTVTMGFMEYDPVTFQ